MDVEGLLGGRGSLVGSGAFIQQVGYLPLAGGRAHPQRVERGVAGDRVQPTLGRPPLAAVSRGRPPDVDERLLDDVLAAGTVADQSDDERVHGPPVASVELVERRLVAPLGHQFEQILVAARRRYDAERCGSPGLLLVVMLQRRDGRGAARRSAWSDLWVITRVVSIRGGHPGSLPYALRAR